MECWLTLLARELERGVYQDDSKRVPSPSRGFIYEDGGLIWILGVMYGRDAHGPRNQSSEQSCVAGTDVGRQDRAGRIETVIIWGSEGTPALESELLKATARRRRQA